MAFEQSPPGMSQSMKIKIGVGIAMVAVVVLVIVVRMKQGSQQPVITPQEMVKMVAETQPAPQALTETVNVPVPQATSAPALLPTAEQLLLARTGRYVAIKQPAAMFLNISEIKVLRNGVNIARGVPVVMSSQYGAPNYGGELLVDGNETNFAHTLDSAGQSMTLDLGSDQIIDQIIIVNRADFTSRLTGSSVELTNAAGNHVWTSVTISDMDGGTVASGANNGRNVLTYTLPEMHPA